MKNKEYSDLHPNSKIIPLEKNKMTLKIIDGTPTAISKYLREQQLTEMLKFGNTRKEIVQRASELIQEERKELIEEIKNMLNRIGSDNGSGIKIIGVDNAIFELNKLKEKKQNEKM